MVDRRLAGTIAATGLLLAASCGRAPPQQVPENHAAAAPSPASPAPAIPVPQPALDREQLIVDVLHVLSAAAVGKNDAGSQDQLKGREFEVRLPFGCPGLPGVQSRSWSYDEQKHVLRAKVSADLAAEGVPSSDLLLSGYEGVAGFTIDRPLLLSASCPSPQFGAMNEGQPVIALAQLFTSEDSRIQRPERNYQITRQIEPSDAPARGLELVLSGRLDALRDGRPIHCAASDGAPACIVAVKFDRVAIENPVNGSVLGEWSSW